MLDAMEIRIEAPGLWHRYQKGDAFRRYVDDRSRLVLPVVALLLIFSLATTAGSVVVIGGRHSFLVLFMLVLAPFLLLGTLAVLLFLFFSWLESRALAETLARVRKSAPRKPDLSPRGLRIVLASFRVVLVTTPTVYWAFFAVFVVAPLALLAQLSGAAAVLMLLVLAAAPIAFAYLDR
jgi:hypothetical protein